MENCTQINANSEQVNDIFWQRLEESLKPVFSRQEAAIALGGLVAVNTLKNWDSSPKCCKVRVRIGNKVGYERSSFVAFLKDRFEVLDTSRVNDNTSLPATKNSTHSDKTD